MTGKNRTDGDLFEVLARVSTCIIASAIETMHVRLPNTGFSDPSIRCIFKDRGPIAGYAATLRIRSANPPIEGGTFYESPGFFSRTDWWDYVLSVSSPRIAVIEDIDHPPGLGAFIGEVHAHILRAMGCIGLVTNGGVRDLVELEQIGIQMFAGKISISHAYAHVVDFGGPVRVGGVTIQHGDLIHGDRHGIQTIPPEVSERLPFAAQEIERRRRRLIELCQAPDFSAERLRQGLKSDLPG